MTKLGITRYMIMTQDYLQYYSKNKQFRPLSSLDYGNPMLYRTQKIAKTAMKLSCMDGACFIVVPVQMTIEVDESKIRFDKGVIDE